MDSFLYQKDLVSISGFSRDDIIKILDVAAECKRRQEPALLKGKILASCFFEPSTRTRLSFESAMLKLGGSCLGFGSCDTTSSTKGETLWDSMKIIQNYADIIVIRHPREGTARLAADAAAVPVINAGDGANQHPTQTFLDLFTIRESQNGLDNLHIAICGDLRYGRTAHSLALSLIPFRCRLYFVSPENFEMPRYICEELRERGARFSLHDNIRTILPKLDILYMTRLQKERFTSAIPQKIFALDADMFSDVKDNFRILHPLPRNEEIAVEVDKTKYACYFQQAQNGLYVRQALLKLILCG